MSRRQVKKVYWGVLFLLGALALLLGKLGYLEGFGFWTVFFSIILAGVLIDGILRRSFGEILFPLAGLVIIHDELLHLETITPWPVLGAALLGTIGLHIIFPGRKRWKIHDGYSAEGVCQYGEEDGEILSGEKIRYECSFGNMELYVPAGWNVVINIDNSFGGVEESGHGNPNGENTLFVSGEVSFGHMIIHHI